MESLQAQTVYVPPFAEPANEVETEINAKFSELFLEPDASDLNKVAQVFARVPETFGLWYHAAGGWTRQGWRIAVSRLSVRDMLNLGGSIVSELQGMRIEAATIARIRAVGGEVPDYLTEIFDQECNTPNCPIHGTIPASEAVKASEKPQGMTGGIL